MPKKIKAISSLKKEVQQLRKETKEKAKVNVQRNAGPVISKGPAVRAGPNDTSRESMAAASNLLDPFYGYSNNVIGGIPFVTNVAPMYGFWSRTVAMVTETVSATGQYFARVIVAPWHVNTISFQTTISAAGVPTSYGYYNDNATSFITSNMNTTCVAYQAMRVRNVTAIASMAGVGVIGNTSILEAGSNAILPTSTYPVAYEVLQQNRLAYNHMNSDPGVMLQMTYQGNTRATADTANAICDYQLVDSTLNVFDNELRCMYFASNSKTQQTYEVEVITQYLCEPYATSTNLFPMSRHTVNPVYVFNELDKAYNKSGQFDIGRCAIRDDGEQFLGDIKAIWGGVKAIPRVVSSVSNWIGTAFRELFGNKKTHKAFKALLASVPKEHWGQLACILNASQDPNIILKHLETYESFVKCLAAMSQSRDSYVAVTPCSSPRLTKRF